MLNSLNVFSLNTFSCDSIESSFNRHSLILEYSGKGYSFIVGGHLYGDSQNQLGIYPAASLLSSIDRINATNASFFISLGDNIRESNDLQIMNFVNSFTNKLNIPFFTTLGNHDVYGAPNLFLEKLRKRYYSFIYNGSMFLFLDAITNDGRIEGKQLSWLRTQISLIERNSQIENIFVLSHKPIWYNQIEQMGAFDSRYYHNFNFTQQIMPQLLGLKKELYLISDDFGGTINGQKANLFYHQDLDRNVSYIATGIGENRYDALVMVNIGTNKDVSISEFSLTGADSTSTRQFDIEYFKGLKPYRSRWQKIKSRIYNTYLQLGFVIGVSLTGTLALIVLLYLKKGT
jgi:hypothetical protein